MKLHRRDGIRIDRRIITQRKAHVRVVCEVQRVRVRKPSIAPNVSVGNNEI